MVNAKNLPIFLQIGILLANALNSVGYTYTLLIIDKPNIYQHKGLSKSTMDFLSEYAKAGKILKLAANLRYPT